MRKVLFSLLAVLALVMMTATPAGAITGGQPDGNGHPYGALILVPGWTFCSGTLIDEDVVLTAAHCTDTFATLPLDMHVFVTFDSEASVDPDSWMITGGVWYEAVGFATHPDYDAAAWPFTADYGLVFLDEPVVGIEPAVLPTVGLLGELIGTHGQTAERFLDVGYGQDGVINYAPIVPYIGNFEFIRKVSVQRYNPSVGAVGTLDPMWLILGNVPAPGKGSGCGGDSGSGIFATSLDDTLVAVHTGGYRLGWAGQICGRITSINHRLDMPVVLDWIAGYLD